MPSSGGRGAPTTLGVSDGAGDRQRSDAEGVGITADREDRTAEEAVDASGNRFALVPRSCPTCGPRGADFLGYRGGAFHRYGLGIASRICRCRSCGLLYPDPFPYPVDAQRLYADPAKYFERHDTTERTAGYAKVVDEIVRRTGKEQPSILDIGSGRGELLRAGQERGLTDITGLELATAMIDYARDRYGLTVLAQTMEEHARSAGRTYDAFCLGAVLEHVYDPDATIGAVADVSHPGSVIFIDVPNEPNLLTVVGNGWNRLTRSQAVLNLAPTFPPYHVFGFNRRALSALLGKHGFDLGDVRIWARPHVPSAGGRADAARAFVATQVNRLANWTGTAHNLTAWAVKR